MSEVQGIRCTHCGDRIWSRHRHDFRWCSCGTVAVDGGRSYLKVSFNSTSDFEYVTIEVPDEDSSSPLG